MAVWWDCECSISRMMRETWARWPCHSPVCRPCYTRGKKTRAGCTYAAVRGRRGDCNVERWSIHALMPYDAHFDAQVPWRGGTEKERGDACEQKVTVLLRGSAETERERKREEIGNDVCLNTEYYGSSPPTNPSKTGGSRTAFLAFRRARGQGRQSCCRAGSSPRSWSARSQSC